MASDSQQEADVNRVDELNAFLASMDNEANQDRIEAAYSLMRDDVSEVTK